jgi:hypothetical protein
MKDWSSWLAIGAVSIAAAVAVPVTAEAAAYRMTIKSIPEAGEKCISTAGGPFVQGMRVFIWDCTAGFAQVLDYDDQTQELKFGANCVEVVGRSGGQDIIAVGRCTGSPSQRWTMTAVRDNYQIVNANGLCLEIANGVIANGTPLSLSRCTPDNKTATWSLFEGNAGPTGGSQTQAGGAAQSSAAVRSIFERRRLIGTFAESCGKPPSDSNQHVTHRLTDGGAIEREQLRGPAMRSSLAVIEDAEELGESELATNIAVTESVNPQLTGSKMHLITRVEANRIRLMQQRALTGPFAGTTNIFAGKSTASGGGETRWLTRCR